jgi:hypothetical protein
MTHVLQQSPPRWCLWMQSRSMLSLFLTGCFTCTCTSTLQVHQPTRPSSAQVRPSTEDVGNKLRTSQSNRHSLSATQPATTGAERPRPRPLAATAPSPVPAEAVVNSAPTVTVPPVSSTRQDLGASAQGARATELPESPHRKDWSKVPLPPNWGRKFHKELGRVRKFVH